MSHCTNPQSKIYTAVAPSNIAFVKYWGKRDPELQWPANDSISMTLSNCHTTTSARIIDGAHDFFVMLSPNGEPVGAIESSNQPRNHSKVFAHIKRVKDHLKIDHALQIVSCNSFPTGCGIASSASGYAALTLAVTAALLDEHRLSELNARGVTRTLLADLARKGSGSAGRSLFGGFVQWHGGESPATQSVKQEFAEEQFNLADIVVMFSDQVKHTSSSTAHLAAWGSLLFKPRLAGIPERIKRVHNAIRNRDMESLGHEIELDALEMHAVAMTGQPQVNYFTDNTRDFITWVREKRSLGQLPAWFTIDAGPNVHLICKQSDAKSIAQKIKKDWPIAKIIEDQVGAGPSLSVGSHLDLPTIKALHDSSRLFPSSNQHTSELTHV